MLCSPHIDRHTGRQTHTHESDYCGHPFRVSGVFPSTYHQGSAQYGQKHNQVNPSQPALIPGQRTTTSATVLPLQSTLNTAMLARQPNILKRTHRTILPNSVVRSSRPYLSIELLPTCNDNICTSSFRKK